MPSSAARPRATWAIALLVLACVPFLCAADRLASTLKGLSLTPKSFGADDFKDFFRLAGEAGQVVSWAGDWQELEGDGAPKVVAQLAAVYHYVPLIQAGHYSAGRKALIRPLSAETRRRYVAAARAFAQQFAPPYMAFGVEINIQWENDPDGFGQFVQLSDETCDAVKTASPKTKVLTVFQLERMKGLHGGLWGGADDPAKSEWALLERFAKADLIGFTTYPGLVFKDPAEIPADYYAEVRMHTTKPVAFTEVGWPSDAAVRGWESSEEEQARFVGRFFELTRDLRPEMVIWPFLYDPAMAQPFKSMGLRRPDGQPRQAWAAWLKEGGQP